MSWVIPFQLKFLCFLKLRHCFMPLFVPFILQFSLYSAICLCIVICVKAMIYTAYICSHKLAMYTYIQNKLRNEVVSWIYFKDGKKNCTKRGIKLLALICNCLTFSSFLICNAERLKIISLLAKFMQIWSVAKPLIIFT